MIKFIKNVGGIPDKKLKEELMFINKYIFSI